MARTLKGTRARGLPPKVLLSQRQDATGSFPTVWRTSSDNRTGRYPVFFNDNKVVTFNQPVTNVGFAVTTYPEYEEKVVTIGSSGNPVNQSNPIVFDYLFSGTPFVVLTELTPNANTPTVNAFIDSLTFSGMTIKFSAPFEGTVVYRALYQSSPGNPVNVLRSPRYTDQYSLVVVNGAVFDTTNILGNPNTADITFSDFGSIPTENYVTFYDFYANNQANISSSISVVTNTSVQVTGSAPGDVVLYYMGAGTSTASIDVSGIVYPLVMTPQAINADLSPEAKADLYKQPYFSGSEIVNQPIIASGSMKKNVSDIFVTFTPGQDIEPFQDFANPEVDGKISASIGGVNPFYATGSLVETTGLGFQQPLWSKNKIEIDVTPSSFQQIGADLSSSANYPMCYWNNVSKQYDGVGTGAGFFTPYGTTLADLKTYLSGQAIGFGATLGSGGTSPNDLARLRTMGYPISNFGFPYDPKFQPNANQQLLMQNYISEPFLLEKIVVELSCSFETNAITAGGGSTTAMWNFFVLNSRPEISEKTVGDQTIHYVAGGGGSFSSFVTSSISSNSVSDLITFAQVSFYDPVQTLYGPVRDQIVVPTKTLTSTYWNGQLVLSSSIKNPIGYEKGLLGGFGGANFTYLEDLRISGRSQINQVNGRDWKNSFESPNVIGYWSNPTGGGISIPILAAYKKENPYILLPTDKLTFGWHMPNKANEDTGSPNVSDMSFFTTGINKIILYGSTLRLNPETNQLEEYHDTLNQLLSSNSIHEVIGE
jgi:hypothetical protein